MDKAIEKQIAKKTGKALNLKKVTVKKLNARTGIKALGGGRVTNNSCGDDPRSCHAH